MANRSVQCRKYYVSPPCAPLASHTRSREISKIASHWHWRRVPQGSLSSWRSCRFHNPCYSRAIVKYYKRISNVVVRCCRPFRSMLKIAGRAWMCFLSTCTRVLESTSITLSPSLGIAAVPENGLRSIVRQARAFAPCHAREPNLPCLGITALSRPREAVKSVAHLTQVVLSLSSDHSLFGNDKM